jgi:hypothetical protein
MINHIVVECPRCLNMFLTSNAKARQVGEKQYGIRCRCGNIVEWDLDYLDPVDLWAEQNIANRMRKIESYAVRVEGLTYAKGR